MKKVRYDTKSHTKDTKIIQKLQRKVDELEIIIKRLQLEFSWYDSKNDYAHCVMSDQIRRLDESRLPY